MTELWRIALGDAIQACNDRKKREAEKKLKREHRLRQALVPPPVITLADSPIVVWLPRRPPPPPPAPLSQVFKPLRTQSPRPITPTPPRIEDYTGSLCLLHTLTDKTPYYMEVLIDIEDFDRVAQSSWIIVYEGPHREPRVARSEVPRYLHRFVTDAPAEFVVDHQFHNTLDARRSKLRVCTVGQNNLNRRPRRKASSRFKGVSLCKKSGRWKVMCGARGKKVFLGSYRSEVDAAIVYNEFALKTYGPMAYQNPID